MKVCILTAYQPSWFPGNCGFQTDGLRDKHALPLLLELNTLALKYFICEGHFKFSKADRLFPELSKTPWMETLEGSKFFGIGLTHFTAAVQKAYNTISHWRKINPNWNQYFQTHYVSVTSWGWKMEIFAKCRNSDRHGSCKPAFAVIT